MYYAWLCKTLMLLCVTGGLHALATHVLQFVFIGNTGFRWPVAYYPSTEAHASELLDLVWAVIDALSSYGFKVSYFVTENG